MSKGTFKTRVYPKSKIKVIAVCGAKSLFEVLLLSIKKVHWVVNSSKPTGYCERKTLQGPLNPELRLQRTHYAVFY